MSSLTDVTSCAFKQFSHKTQEYFNQKSQEVELK